MTICYFGLYHPKHPRNVIFIDALKRQGISVIEINHGGQGPAKYLKMARDLFKVRKNIDAIIVGFPGQQAVFIAKLVYRRGPVVLNALLSLYDAVILDRKVYPRFHWRAAYYWLLDFFAFHAADHVIMDCQAYIDFIGQKFLVNRKKCSRIFLGANEKVISPKLIKEDAFVIHYYSSFIPTHGTDVIIRAAKILEPDGISVVFSGRGQCYGRDVALADELKTINVKFTERLPDSEALNEFINSSWVSLGLFSSIDRGRRCISSKVFEALCCGRPVITAYTPAAAELLKDGESVLFSKSGDPASLAEAIIRLKKDDALRLKIAAGGRAAYERSASEEVISHELSALLKRLCSESAHRS